MSTLIKFSKGMAGILVMSALLLWLGTQGRAAAPYSIPVALEGIVSLQGRPAAPSGAWSVSLTVDFYLEGNTFTEASINVTTDQNGMFTISDTGLDPGNYVVTVKNSHTLKVAYAATLGEGSNVINFGSLPEGDANNDNAVTIVDFSILSTSFNLSVGDAGYDSRADFNEDDIITIGDFSLLSTNFGMSGFEISASAFTDLNASQGGRIAGSSEKTPFYGTMIHGNLQDLDYSRVNMHLAVASYVEENILKATVKLNSGDQRFDAAMASVVYDEEALEVKSVYFSEKLPLVLLDQNKKGQLAFAAGTLSDLPSGSIDFVTIEFRVKGVLGEKPLLITGQENAVTFAGRDILGEVSQDDLEAKCSGCKPFNLYPNPGNGIFHVQSVGSQEVQLIIMDSRGIIFKKINLDTILSNQTIDLTGLPSGLYLIQAETETGKSVHRIIKQ